VIVDPDFLDHWRTRMLVDALGGDEAAPMYVLRIWGHCQQRRGDSFVMPAAGLKALCRAFCDAQALETALIDAGFIQRDGASLSVPKWSEKNASLIAAWANGKTGGRPKKEPAENPAETQKEPGGNPGQTRAEPIRLREEQEKNKELPEQPAQSSQPVSCAAEICRALRVAGVTAVQSQHPMLLALVDAGATLTEFVDAVPSAAGKRDAFAYLLSVVKGRREDAAREAAEMVRGGFSAPPKRQPDRKERQLAVAAVMTGAATAASRNPPPETIDVESRVIAP